MPIPQIDSKSFLASDTKCIIRAALPSLDSNERMTTNDENKNEANSKKNRSASVFATELKSGRVGSDETRADTPKY